MTNPTTKPAHPRAPRGGMVSPVNGVFYRGGQFLPLPSGPTVEVKPAPLAGSSRQVAWANRLRQEALNRISADIATRRLFLNDAKVIDEAGVRRAIERDELARYRLLTERSASAVIERRMAFA